MNSIPTFTINTFVYKTKLQIISFKLLFCIVFFKRVLLKFSYIDRQRWIPVLIPT